MSINTSTLVWPETEMRFGTNPKLVGQAKLTFTASWQWWHGLRYMKRWPMLAYYMKEATKLERLHVEKPKTVKVWFEKYKDMIEMELGITLSMKLVPSSVMVDRRKVVDTKGKKAGRGELEERDRISVLAGGVNGWGPNATVASL